MGDALKGWLGVALMVGWPLIPVALVQYGRHQGWQQHQSCLQEALRRDPEPEPAGSHSLMRQTLGLPPAGETTAGDFARELLGKCQTLP